MTQKKDKSMPLLEIRSGLIKATIWRHETGADGRVRLSVRVQKHYEQRDGTYKPTDSFFPHEVPRLIVLLHRCYEYIVLSDTRERKEATRD